MSHRHQGSPTGSQQVAQGWGPDNRASAWGPSASNGGISPWPVAPQGVSFEGPASIKLAQPPPGGTGQAETAALPRLTSSADPHEPIIFTFSIVDLPAAATEAELLRALERCVQKLKARIAQRQRGAA